MGDTLGMTYSNDTCRCPLHQRTAKLMRQAAYRNLALTILAPRPVAIVPPRRQDSTPRAA